MHGTYFANHSVFESDLLIAIGARFDDRVTGKISTFIPDAKVIHIDIDPASVSKNVVVDVPIVGDCKNVLTEINKIIKAPKIDPWLKTSAGQIVVERKLKQNRQRSANQESPT